METAASFEARFAPSSYPTTSSRGWQQPAKTPRTRLQTKGGESSMGLANESVGAMNEE